MKFYIVENQKPAGPFEVQELIAKGIKGSDLVWAEGMKDWARAESVDEIREALYAASSGEQTCDSSIPDIPSEPCEIPNQMPPCPPASQAYCQQPYGQPQQPYNPTEIPPKTWLVESILVTLFCCLPFGIVGIIKASSVSSLWQVGRYEESRFASSAAKKWTTIGFIAGIVVAILYIAGIAAVAILEKS